MEYHSKNRFETARSEMPRIETSCIETSRDELACSKMALLSVGLTLTVLCSLQSTQQAEAYIEEYIPVSTQDKKQKVSLKTVSDAGLKDGKVVKLANAEMTLPYNSDDLVFTGKDASGKKWTLAKTYYGLGSAFFTTDLDQNGELDIVILQATGGCGIAPNAVLTTIMFDKSGRPFPTETSGYFSCPDPNWGEKSKTTVIDDLVSFGTDKRAVLICQQLDNAVIRGRSHSYWRIPIYRANNCRWERISKYRNNSVPMMVRYTNKGNVKVIPPPVPALREYEDLSFTRADEGKCMVGLIKDVQLEEKQIKRLQINNDIYDQPNWKYLQPFLIKETQDSLELMALNSEKSINFLQKAVETKTKVRFSKPSKQGVAPTYLWILN